MIEPTKEEQKFLTRLRRTFNAAPKGVWFFVTGDSITMLRLNENGERTVTGTGGVDPDYEIGSVDGIAIDGGDW